MDVLGENTCVLEHVRCLLVVVGGEIESPKEGEGVRNQLVIAERPVAESQRFGHTHTSLRHLSLRIDTSSQSVRCDTARAASTTYGDSLFGKAPLARPG